MRIALCLTALVAAAPAVKPPAVEIKEWPVPWPNTFTRDPYVAPDGRVFFCGMAGNYIGVLDTVTGQFKRFELPRPANPHSLIVDPQGKVWYTGNGGAHIGRLDPTTGEVTKFPMPDPAARDPHSLAWDPAGDIWFTVQGSNFVGKLTVATGAIRLIAVPTPRALPYGIVIDPSGRPWIDLFGTNKLATVDPATFTLREITLPRAAARPRRIARTSDGRIWYGDYAGGFLGAYDPKTEQTREWAMPSGTSAQPYAMVSDAKDRVWFVETGVQPNRFVGFDSKTSTFLDPVPVPSGGRTVRNMVFDPKGNAVWFATDLSTVGRARLP
jgi:virginiamycin B lyase